MRQQNRGMMGVLALVAGAALGMAGGWGEELRRGTPSRAPAYRFAPIIPTDKRRNRTPAQAEARIEAAEKRRAYRNGHRADRHARAMRRYHPLIAAEPGAYRFAWWAAWAAPRLGADKA